MKGFTVFSTVSITFETTYDIEDTSQMFLALTGSTFELGNWDVNNCVSAKESPVGSGHWTTTVELPAKDKFYWKWMVVPMDRSEVIRWEEVNRDSEYQRSYTVSQISYSILGDKHRMKSRDGVKFSDNWKFSDVLKFSEDVGNVLIA